MTPSPEMKAALAAVLESLHEHASTDAYSVEARNGKGVIVGTVKTGRERVLFRLVITGAQECQEVTDA